MKLSFLVKNLELELVTTFIWISVKYHKPLYNSLQILSADSVPIIFNTNFYKNLGFLSIFSHLSMLKPWLAGDLNEHPKTLEFAVQTKVSSEPFLATISSLFTWTFDE